ncbi:MAG: Bax inhibitor-1/YccA family protein [Chlamydiales bacterium]
MNTSNPALMSNTFSGFGSIAQSDAMTVRGTVNKTAILLLLVLLPAAYVWNLFNASGQNPASVATWMWAGLIGGLVLSMVTIFKKNWAPLSAPLYAVMEGLFLGGLSVQFQKAYPGIVMQAVSLSLATLLMMLAAYQSGWIRPSERFKLGIVAATGGIMVVYLVAIVLGFFGINVSFIQGNGLFSILFSGFVCIIAALNFILDFDFIQQGARSNVPKYMEWYGAFALMVTLVWLYIEILRLLAKLNSRR